MLSLQLPLLQALGYAIANSLWQMALLWLIATLLNSITRRSSHIRYITALSAQVAGFAWFLTTLQFYYQHCLDAAEQAQQALLQNSNVAAQNFITGSNQLLSFVIRAEETLPYLSLAYLLLLSVLLVKWLRNFRYTKRLSGEGLQAFDAKWQTFVNEMADRLNIMQEVKVSLSSFAKSPLTIGYLKPVILLPLASINHLSTEQLEAVLLHELAHIKRDDYIINMLVSIAEMILFFNPFTRLLSKTIAKERENCCDDWVLQYQYDAGMYAEALLRIAYLQKETGFGMNAASNRKGELLQRVKRMVQPGEISFNYKHQLLSLLSITALLFFIAWLQPAQSIANLQTNKAKTPQKPIVVAPLSAQIENPFFNGASLLAPSLQEEVNESLAELHKTMHDSDVITSLREAHKALSQTAPTVLSAMSSADLKKMISDAKKEATRSLQSADWTDFQQSLPQLIDSLNLTETAGKNWSREDEAINNLRQGWADAREQFASLQNEKTISQYLNQNFLQQISANALAAVAKVNWDAIKDSVTKASAVAQNVFAEQQKLFQKRESKQEDLIKILNKAKQKSAVLMMRREQPPMAPQPFLTPTLTEERTVNIEPAAFTFSNDAAFGYSSPAPHSAERSQHAKTIRIVSRSDSSAINIVIEME